MVANGKLACANQSKIPNPESALNTSKYSSNLYENPTVSLAFMNPEKINRPPTKNLALCVTQTQLPIIEAPFIRISCTTNKIAKVVLLKQGGQIKYRIKAKPMLQMALNNFDSKNFLINRFNLNRAYYRLKLK